ncbi:MAG: XRE family transcriptional regulator [Candidatus Eremiobacteraeota bacterium]|nr:XRE family transcriptional regulator [Candidatus Eremiobacteraeota bacterium]
MAGSIKAMVEAEMLIWARKNSGLDIDMAAKKAQVKPEKLTEWENGNVRPTIKQLRKLGKVYKRPIAFFYLPEPPRDFQAMKDCRRFPGVTGFSVSPELIYEIRRAFEKREIAIELYKAMDSKPPELKVKASLSDDPEKLGDHLRKVLDVKFEEQIQFKSSYDALNYWRSKVEERGVLVFSATDVKIEEMRGFAIGEPPLPAIVVNIKDSPYGRVFSIIHELVHIILKESCLCDSHDAEDLPPEKREVEIFCNAVAGCTLVPRRNILKEELVEKKTNACEWTDDELKGLAKRYGVSRETMLRRLLEYGRTNESFYKEKRAQFIKEYTQPQRKRKKAIPQPYRIAISKAGRPLVKLVLNNYYKQTITSSDVSDFLEIRLKHLKKIEDEVMGPNIVID